MFISKKYNIQWWFPMHVGSSVTRHLLTDIGFEPIGNQHQIIPNFHYNIIVSVRNPYSLAISIWRGHVKRYDISFEDYVREHAGEYVNYNDVSEMDYVEHSKNRQHKIFKIVRQESLFSDLSSLYFIEENKESLKEKLKDIENKKRVHRGELVKSMQFEKMYNQELADIIYQNRKKFFEFGGYEKDSWKDMIY